MILRQLKISLLERPFYLSQETKLMNKIPHARNFATKKHKYQLRKDCKTPYWHHLRMVVKNLQNLGIKNQDILCAGWLHDTIEDTNTDFDDLKELFGTTTAKIVSQVTKDTRIPYNKREYLYLQQLRKASWQAKAVKLGDILANISDMKNSGYSNQKKKNQVKDKIKYLLAIKPGISKNKSQMPGLQKIESQLNDLLTQYDQKRISLT